MTLTARYLYGSGYVGTLSWAMFAFIRAEQLSLPIVSVLLFFANLSCALSDVVVDAVLASITPKDGSPESRWESAQLLALTQYVRVAGGVLGTVLGVVGLPALGPVAMVGLTAGCSVLIIPGSKFMGTLGDGASGAGAVLGAAVDAEADGYGASPARWDETWARLWTVLRWLSGAEVRRALLWIVLMTGMPPDTRALVTSFKLDRLGLSSTFLGAESLLSWGCLGLGAHLYARHFANTTMGCALAWAAVLGGLVSSLDLMLVLHANRAVGLPDWLFVLGADAAAEAIVSLKTAPLFVFANQRCPRGAEGLVVATFASTVNLSRSMATASGGALAQHFGVSGGKAYSGLALVVAIRVALVLAPLGLLPLFPPELPGRRRTKQKERIV